VVDKPAEDLTPAESTSSRRAFLARAGTVGVSLTALGGAFARPTLARGQRRATRAVSGGTVTVGADAVGADFVPSHIFQGRGHEMALLALFDGLYWYPNDNVSKPYQEQLATAFPTSSADGLVYTIPVRKGVMFHDGTPFNAEAVEFNYMRYLDPHHPYYDPNAGANVPATFLIDVDNVKAIDDYTVQITASAHLGDFIASIVPFNGSGIMSPTAVMKAGVANAGIHPVGTGPFRFVEDVEGDHVTLAAFDEYWGGRPFIDTLVIREIPDPGTLTASMLTGEVDISTFIERSDVPTFKANPKFDVAVIPGVVTGYMGLNVTGTGGFKTLSDVRLRLAACHAIDKKALIQLGLFGFGAVGAGVNPPASWGYQKSLLDYNHYNPTLAKSLIKAAGGVKNDLLLIAPSSGYFPQLAVIIQSYLNAVGFTTNIQTLDSAIYYNTFNEGKQDIGLGEGAPDVFSPYSLYKTFFGHDGTRIGRWGGWDNSTFDGTVNRLFATSNRATDVKLIQVLDLTLLKGGIFQTNY